ncbi:MAG: uracil-DNA glycosylase family protein [Muribaculaceae bacterium]|nr:uracil-DNA glycosylase family protein [Muribaculaceae bacterium]
MTELITDAPLERHPWPPYIPPHARILIMGTFPPQPKRWAMDFYYPNRTNDFWKIMGLIFTGDATALYNPTTRQYDIASIKRLLNDHGIALNDTAREVRRLAGNASDKFLEIVTPVPLADLLKEMPECRTVATTGEKAAGVVAELTNTPLPKMGEMVTDGKGLEIWRMPSTSRAYPLPLEKKAEYYEQMFRHIGIVGR